MHLHAQTAVETLLKQDPFSLGLLHADLEEAILEVGARWADRYPDPTKMRGLTLATSMRDTLLDMAAKRGPVDGTTLKIDVKKSLDPLDTKEGQGMSVVLHDRHGTEIRVRKWPSPLLKIRDKQFERPVSPPPPGQREALVKRNQMILDEGIDSPIFPRTSKDDDGGFGLYVLWSRTEDGLGVEVFVAAVVSIDSPCVSSILALAPMPPAIHLPKPSAGGKTPPTIQRGPAQDFDEFDDGAAASGSDTTPA